MSTRYIVVRSILVLNLGKVIYVLDVLEGHSKVRFGGIYLFRRPKSPEIMAFKSFVRRNVSLIFHKMENKFIVLWNSRVQNKL